MPVLWGYHDLQPDSHIVNRTAQASGKAMQHLACSNACKSPGVQWTVRLATCQIRTIISRLRMEEVLEDEKPRRERRPEDYKGTDFRCMRTTCSHMRDPLEVERLSILETTAMLTCTPALPPGIDLLVFLFPFQRLARHLRVSSCKHMQIAMSCIVSISIGP